jgi:hypothetical protein
MTKRKIPTPYSEQTRLERIATAESAIARLESQLTGNNRFGAYGDSIRDSLQRWRDTLAMERQAEGLQ